MMAQRISSKAQLVSLIGVSYEKYAAPLLEGFACYVVQTDFIEWKQYTVEAVDLLIVKPLERKHWFPDGYIIADATYVDKCVDDAGVIRCTYTQANMVTLKKAVKYLTMRTQVPTVRFTRMPCDIPMRHETCNSILQMALYKNPKAASIAKREIKSICESGLVLPSLMSLMDAYNVQAGETPVSYIINLFDLLKFAPFLVAERLAVLRNGVATIEKSAFQAQYQRLVGYLLKQKCQTDTIKSICASIQQPELTCDEQQYIDRIKRAKTLSFSARRANYLKTESKLPKCLQALLLTSERWNNYVRFQLAFVCSSFSNLTSVDVDVITHVFLEHMKSTNMGENRVKHFLIQLKRNQQDSMPCRSRVHGEGIKCHYGGGDEGVDLCCKDLNIVHKMTSPTISEMWAASTAE